MTVNFYKYQGTGNDFIMIDNRRRGGISKNQTGLIEHLCNRKFGIGADGLILLQEKMSVDFEMVYFNSDGHESTMCGNGGRCLIKFAHDLGVIKDKCTFEAIDGLHEGQILSDGIISLKMNDVSAPENYNGGYILNTGSPHYVLFANEVAKMDIVTPAKKIRYGEKFSQEGINVNFVEKKGANKLFVRTYERGVEDETLSCGTGVVASALAFASKSKTPLKEVDIETPGGHLTIKFKPIVKGFNNVYLVGPAVKIFEGVVEV